MRVMIGILTVLIASVTTPTQAAEIRYLTGFSAVHQGLYKEPSGYELCIFGRCTELHYQKEFNEDNRGSGICKGPWCWVEFPNSYGEQSYAVAYRRGLQSPRIAQDFHLHLDGQLGVVSGYPDWVESWGIPIDDSGLRLMGYPSVGVSYWITQRLGLQLNYTRVERETTTQIFSLELVTK